MGYEKNRFLDNIHALVKRQKVKIGELESSCGVSVGYFARLRQGAENAAPSADLLLAVADRLSVSVDALLTFDFTQLSESEQKLLNYMERLRFETETRKLAWQRDLAGAGNPVPLNPDGTSAHPLFTSGEGLLTMEEMEEDGLPDSVSLSQSVYRSVFRPDLEDLIPVEIYRCRFPGKRILYLAAVADQSAAESASKKPVDLELVMSDPKVSDPIPFVRLESGNPGNLDKPLVSLYTAVKKTVGLPALKPEAEAIIDDYLK